jgi:hypothetical protein
MKHLSQGHLVKTSFFKGGLTPKHVEKAIKILNKEKKDV